MKADDSKDDYLIYVMFCTQGWKLHDLAVVVGMNGRDSDL